MRIGLIGTFLLGLVFISNCGYHVAGKMDFLPTHIQTIAVMPFNNTTTQYKATDLLSGALTREFLSRTRYRITADPAQADAVLSGTILRVGMMTAVTGKTAGADKTTGVDISIVLQITLTERSTNKVLFNQPGLRFRDRYEISTNNNAYFEESGVALQRLSRDVARSVVSAILEQF
jgi:Lipopolysaccharide-assembly